MDNQGWIRLHRKLKNHWLWSSDNRLKWWIDLLLTVNYTENKVLLKGTLIDCGRGQSVKSLGSYAKDWGVTKKTVSDFFKLLSKDKMIFVENMKITTRITIINYDSYNDAVNASYTPSKRQLPTNNKENKEKKVNKENKEKKIDIIENFRNEFDFFDNEFETYFKEFIELKKRKKASVKELILKNQLKKIEKLTAGDKKKALEILAKSVNSGWTDFYGEKKIQKKTEIEKKPKQEYDYSKNFKW